MLIEDRNSPAYCKLRFTDWPMWRTLAASTRSALPDLPRRPAVDMDAYDAHRKGGIWQRPGEVGMVLQGKRVYAAWG